MSALDVMLKKKYENATDIEKCLIMGFDGSVRLRLLEKAADELAELRRLIALLTAEPLHITRADIDAAKRILRKAEEQ